MYDNPYHNCDLSKFTFLVTGGAGFIGSNIVAYLLRYGAGKVRVLDNFSTGFRKNLLAFEHHPAFELLEGDIRDADVCSKAVQGVDYISHQAALGSVPRSVNDPLTTNAVNVTGFLNMLSAVKESGRVQRLVYAASSSTYGDSQELPKVEERIGRPLSPYAVTKYINELYADVFAKTYGLELIGLRYFNVFGPKQSPAGEYAAVIPMFIQAVKENRPAFINGDGEQTRDFTFVQNAVQANIRAFFVDNDAAINQVYNVACGEQVSLNQLWSLITENEKIFIQAQHRADRIGDVRHSIADISKAQRLLGYAPDVMFQKGLAITMDSFGDADI
ncbi:SDR family oxidoreductase [Mucilaginibacter lacusdianchii]|uniref:SDR family oxidoreductase n=1 Tax=Mucilaginibacter lacusdianchii TaxID=2684211 RepID=UPI00131D62A0|nr:SDR family oxidoreductase [Mucilaginibacter sp. JXJ CY 39]